MATCQVCISGISNFTLEHPTTAESKNFSTVESITFYKSTLAAGLHSSDTGIDEMIRELKKSADEKKVDLKSSHRRNVGFSNGTV